MRISHVSDNHGIFTKLYGYFDIIVHSGDLLPNPPAVGLPAFGAWQMEWVADHINNFKDWIGNHPFLFCLGNHDFVNPRQLMGFLQENGIEAYDLIDKVVSYEGINFYGFPYVPPITGWYAYEQVNADMVAKVDQMVEVLNATYVDVLVAHCPPFGCLDLDLPQNQRFGNTAMANALDYKINEDMMPGYFLTGHIHSSNAVAMRKNVLVSNAATVQHLIEV